jgi:two-component system response regulator
MTKPILISIIEDNQDDYEAITRAFRTNGLKCSITWYDRAQKYLEYLQEIEQDLDNFLSPSLIILDLNMPGFDGRKILELIKSSHKMQVVPVIILTTSTDDKDIERCYQSGANTYIQKPVNFEKMKKVCSTLEDYWFKVAVLPHYEIKEHKIE